MSNIVQIENKTPAVATPMELLDRALQSNVSAETLTKLMDLQERWERSQSRKAFDQAIANAKAEIQPIVRNAKGHNEKRYADFAAIASAVDPVISKHGLSYRFRTVQNERISVTCVLSHKDGHFEETTLAGPADTTGNKNAIQAIGSTLTYLQRYSLVQALGLAATNDDDGKASSGGDLISEDQVGELIAMAQSVRADEKKFLEYFKIAKLADLPAKDYPAAVTMLCAKGRG